MDWPAQLLLHVGEERNLRLAGFSSGGYRWTAEVQPPGGAVSASVTPIAHETAPGSRDEQVTIRGTAAGHATVAVTLARSWEPEPIERHMIDVRVEAPTDTSP
jgi:predicted secreted protein